MKIYPRTKIHSKIIQYNFTVQIYSRPKRCVLEQKNKIMINKNHRTRKYSFLSMMLLNALTHNLCDTIHHTCHTLSSFHLLEVGICRKSAEEPSSQVLNRPLVFSFFEMGIESTFFLQIKCCQSLCWKYTVQHWSSP